MAAYGLSPVAVSNSLAGASRRTTRRLVSASAPATAAPLAATRIHARKRRPRRPNHREAIPVTVTRPLSILIADGNRTNLALMDMLARKLPNSTTQLFTDPKSVRDRLAAVSFDVAVIDSQMPGVGGIELARSIRAHGRLATRPILIVTSDPDPAVRDSALKAGASDVMLRPIEPVEFKTRLSALARGLPAAEPPRAEPPLPVAASPNFRSVEEELVGAFARAAGHKDRETPLHATRVACYCAIIAQQLGLSEEAAAELRLAAPLHDIGKVGLRDDVLQNRGFLSEEQRRHMSEHTLIGHAILSAGRSRVLKLAAEIALTHHERWDGGGYPRGLRGEDIPLPGRIAAVADVFDALTSLRPYKRAWSMNHGFSYLSENAGLQFDPRCVAAFQAAREEVEAVMALMPDLLPEADADAA
jgi:putative two-component system response regulator